MMVLAISSSSSSSNWPHIYCEVLLFKEKNEYFFCHLVSLGSSVGKKYSHVFLKDKYQYTYVKQLCHKTCI